MNPGIARDWAMVIANAPSNIHRMAASSLTAHERPTK
jgi:hypothetical protein